MESRVARQVQDDAPRAQARRRLAQAVRHAVHDVRQLQPQLQLVAELERARPLTAEERALADSWRAEAARLEAALRALRRQIGVVRR